MFVRPCIVPCPDIHEMRALSVPSRRSMLFHRGAVTENAHMRVWYAVIFGVNIKLLLFILLNL